MTRRVVVTGFGLVSPIGNNPEVFFNNLLNGVSGIKFDPEMERYGLKCQVAGEPEISIQEEQIIQKYNAEKLSSAVKYSILALESAAKMANIKLSNKFDTPLNEDLGIILGSLSGSVDLYLQFYQKYIKQGKIHKFRPLIAETMMNSGVSAYLSGITGAGGCVLSNSNACASGTESIVLGYERIKNGSLKQAIVGGYESKSMLSWSVYDSMRVLGSDSNFDPQNSSRPMNEHVDGFIPAAGAGILIIEDLEYALKRGANICAEIIGGFINSGAQRNGGTMSAPNCSATVKCIESAINMSGIDLSSIDYLSGHLTSTMADVLEIENWTKALKRKGADFPYINSVKSMTGHCIGAAGAIEFIAAILQMQKSMIHPNINCTPLHPKILKLIDINSVPLENLHKEINNFVKLSLGFGDVNACLVTQKYKQ